MFFVTAHYFWYSCLELYRKVWGFGFSKIRVFVLFLLTGQGWVSYSAAHTVLMLDGGEQFQNRLLFTLEGVDMVD